MSERREIKFRNYSKRELAVCVETSDPDAIYNLKSGNTVYIQFDNVAEKPSNRIDVELGVSHIEFYMHDDIGNIIFVSESNHPEYIQFDNEDLNPEDEEC